MFVPDQEFQMTSIVPLNFFALLEYCERRHKSEFLFRHPVVHVLVLDELLPLGFPEVDGAIFLSSKGDFDCLRSLFSL